GKSQELLARIRQHDSPPMPMEQGLAYLYFHLPDLLAQVRLSHAQRHGGAAEASFLGNPHEKLELSKVHTPIQFKSGISPALGITLAIADFRPKALTRQIRNLSLKTRLRSQNPQPIFSIND